MPDTIPEFKAMLSREIKALIDDSKFEDPKRELTGTYNIVYPIYEYIPTYGGYIHPSKRKKAENNNPVDALADGDLPKPRQLHLGSPCLTSIYH